MSITFNCEHCGKKVEAPDSAGGKRGKCPYCKQSNYIPAPVGEERLVREVRKIEEERKEERRAEKKERDKNIMIIAVAVTIGVIIYWVFKVMEAKMRADALVDVTKILTK